MRTQLPDGSLLSPVFQPPTENLSDSLLGSSSVSNVGNDGRHQLLRFDVDGGEKDTTQLLKLAHFRTVFAAMCFSEFIRAIDSVVLPVILPGIVRDLSASSSEGYLSGSAFLLFQTISQPLYKGLAEAFGDKPCLLVALTTFAAASIFSGVAKNPEWLIAGRSLQGVGAGGMDIMCNIMMSKIVPLGERGKFAGFLQLFGAVGLVVGMLLASVLEMKLSWRWVFYLNPFLVIVPTVIFVLFFQENRQHRIRESLRRTDWLGMASITVSCAGILYSLLFGGAVLPWSAAAILIPLVLGVAGAVVFVLHQSFWKKASRDQIMPGRLFANRTSLAGFMVTVAHGICLIAFLNFFFLYLHVSSSLAILKTSVTLLPSSCLLFSSAAAFGFLTARLKRFQFLIIVGGIMLAAGFGSMIHLRQDANRVEQILLQIPFAVGAGMIFPARLLATQVAQTTEDMPAAAATMTFLFNLGQCFGIPLGSAIYQQVWTGKVDSEVSSNAIPPAYVITSRQAESTAEIIKDWPQEIADIYRSIMAFSISGIWILCSVLGAVIALLGIIIRDELRQRSEGGCVKQQFARNWHRSQVDTAGRYERL